MQIFRLYWMGDGDLIAESRWISIQWTEHGLFPLNSS